MNVLIVYHSQLGSVARMARLIARGVEAVPGCNALVRTVPNVSAGEKPPSSEDSHDALVDSDELANCDALIVGSPTRFGNMSCAMKHFIDGTSSLWMSGSLAGKPAAVFTSSSSMHGGQESTLLSMMLPLLHHGMVICGIPYTEPALSRTQGGGTPYGASHVAGSNNLLPISDDEKKLCIALGKRIAHLTLKLGTTQTSAAPQ